ncbi:hypothetical protein [Atopococcus tabaci]|uniref:hypothetical protein n=1 Tax=Atopococcus tabaci TaxID=269774 RepID=UPI00041ED942|nr:hypothetical protein [Atopococcus tabaci]
MKAEQYTVIKEHVPDIEKYSKEVGLIEEFFVEKNLQIEKTTPVFWNHVITLMERIDNDEQNDLDLDQTEEMSKTAKELTKDFVDHLNQSRAFETTDFENYLLTIYFEQLKNEKETNQ